MVIRFRLRALVGGWGRIAEHAHVCQPAGFLLGLRHQQIQLLFVQLQVAIGLGIFLRRGFLEAFHQRTRDHVLDAVRINVMQVLARSRVTIRRVILARQHLLVRGLIHQETHGSLILP